MIKKTKRDKYFKLNLGGDVVEFEAAMFDGVSKEKKGEILHIYWASAKRQERETRCLNADGTRCRGKCCECSRTRDGQPLSMDQMDENGMLPQDCFSVEEYIEKQELYQALYAAIDMLDEKDRQIILLIFLEGHSEWETGEIISLSQSTVHYRKGKALKILKEFLANFR